MHTASAFIFKKHREAYLVRILLNSLGILPYYCVAIGFLGKFLCSRTNAWDPGILMIFFYLSRLLDPLGYCFQHVVQQVVDDQS